MKQFNTSKENTAKSVQFELDGQRYKFKYPKLGKLLNIVAASSDTTLSDNARSVAELNALLDWFWAGLRGKGEERIKARLADDNDNLSEEEVINIINWLLGEMGKGEPAKS